MGNDLFHIKAATFQTVVLQTPDSPWFSQAQFLLRRERALPQGLPDGGEDDPGQENRDSEMLREANRILALYGKRESARKKEKRPHSPLFFFSSGLLCGFLFFVCAALLLIFAR